ncbi:nucleolar Jumonji domain interacting protein, putative [Plasmodium gallinaceum]|uniref:Nucleolar Jumonji domain interacting protein, putative n=1 Tax=Plasmodium gallinaceum TaxID=5849 RepID=A0A1J1GKU4_PLAGA|nr:nucleolar Jumonji domain interacting protein, putative [Plasmodium gallinaceum]CRG93032.1 nucleolar Jumonji domain interacting protein, putative [Plasmodium gallinaceum]
MKGICVSIDCETLIFDLEFHPKLDMICAGLFNGNLILYKLNDDKKKFQKKWDVYNHEKALRCVTFSKNGNKILAASSDNNCSITDITGKVLWKNKCHDFTINSILFTSSNTFLTTDERGFIKHWDLRDESRNPIHKIKEFDDTISSMLLDPDEKSVVISSGGYIALYDILNKKKISSHSISTEYDDEFLSLQFIAHNTKIACATLNGYITIFSKKHWGNIEGKLKASKDIINTFVKLDEYTICYGTSDGIIKSAHLLPNKIGKSIGRHNGNDSIEKLAINKKKNLLASVSHDNSIKFYPIEIKNSHISNKMKKRTKSFFRDL